MDLIDFTHIGEDLGNQQGAIVPGLVDDPIPPRPIWRMSSKSPSLFGSEGVDSMPLFYLPQRISDYGTKF